MSQQNATAADAELILKLYDLRREPEMRKARNYMAVEFWPKSADDILKLVSQFGSQENAWLRQVSGYWTMAASLVLRGALNEQLFFDSSAEMYFIYCKFRPFIKELREKLNQPEFMQKIETLAERTPEGKQRIEAITQRQKTFLTQRTAAA
jgi:hypothetical protein